MIHLLSIIVISYLIGSIPTSIITGKFLKNIDIRDHGSGNAGGTNAFRVLGWKAGLFVTIIDILKGVFTVIYISQLTLSQVIFPLEVIQIAAGFSAIIGHIWTIFAGFRGGKGVATAAGMMIGLYPLAMLISFSIFALVLAISRYVSLSSMLGAISIPIILKLLNSLEYIQLSDLLFYFSCLIAVLIVITHRKNIVKIINGTENKVGQKKEN